MKILISNLMLKKLDRRQLPEYVQITAINEINHLDKLKSDKREFNNYLNTLNCKKLKGAKDGHTFKFHANDYRIFCTYGKYLPGIRDKDKDSFVILDCVSHDAQKNFQISYQMNNFMNINTMFVYNKKSNLDELDVYLSDEQNNCIEKYFGQSKPTLITGGAGSGKTIVALHFLYEFQCIYPDKQCIYFTQSKELLDLVQKKYYALLSNSFENNNEEDSYGINYTINDNVEKNVSFCNINEYCKLHLNLASEPIYYESFRSNLFEEYENINSLKSYKKSGKRKNDKQKIQHWLEKNQISIFDLWAEIRGSLKGALDKDWHRTDWFNQDDFKHTTIKELEKNDLIIRNRQEPKKFQLTEKVYDKEILQNLTVQTYTILKNIYQISKRVNSQMKMLSKEDYFKISEENTTLEKEKREFLYEFCRTEYQPWLDSMGYKDENDLALMMLEKLGREEAGKGDEKPIEKYDFIVIDEIQDYTELQIYLISKLVKHNSCFIMAGDSHQIVNPTMFREDRLNTLFKNELNVNKLSKNYRCQSNIVDYANAIAHLRNRYIGKVKGYEDEIAVHVGPNPCIMDYTEDNIIQLLNKLLDYTGAMILVPDEFVKNKLIDFYGRDAYEAKTNNVIFTIAEMKGAERRSVFCYNIVSYHHDIWTQIICNGTAKKKTKYQYYFNLLYVAVSRAQEHLCFIEENPNKYFTDAIEQELHMSIAIIKEYSETELHLDELSNDVEDWLRQANDYKEQGKYSDAIDSFQHAEKLTQEGEGFYWREIMECKMKLCIQQLDYQKAMEYALCLNDLETAKSYYGNIQKNTQLFKLIKLWVEPSTILEENCLKEDIIVKWIDVSFPDLELDFRKKIILNYIQNLSIYMLKQLKSIEEEIEIG